ncbi:MAG: bifunctional (p)ppGpp synthetase/guanosine-3',5'-bis(diphosphate) 3'-pyrophosphohydrolase [Mycobacteriales bacterium]
METPAAHPAPTQPAPTQPAPTQPAPTQPAAPAPASAVLESAPLSSTSRPPSTAPTRRVRGKLARLATPGKTAVAPEIEPILKTVRATHAKADLRPVQRAYEVAEARHRGQTRRSGDAYITHPLAVAGILAELGMDVTTLVAALLHDTVEDTGATIASIEADFGSDVALVVDGVTKLDKVKFGEAAEAETIRKMVIAMARDPRVLVVKLADRLHNMRTLQFLPPEKQERKSREVLEIYAPLAHRLGMNTIKWELEDLAFATLYPKRYDEIARLVSDQAPSRDTFLSEIIERVSAELAGSKIQAEVTGRPKHYYSIYQKMLVRERDFGDIYDLVGVRVTVNSVRDCYAALGAIHAIWNPMPGRFKDYIAMPKFNMYQSLHTTVIGPAGKPVELQIRTSAMHKVAEYGIAAHWKYKESKDAKAVDAELATSAEGTAEMAWLRQILDWQRETRDPGEFLDSLRFDLYAGEVFVFTPKGDVISLPSGATPVDFAYSVHTEVGHRCIGARVNGRLVPLESELRNGDVVEIFTSKAATAAPSQDWLQFVRTPRARNKIRQWFARERREDAIEEGKDAISRAMRKQGLPLQRLLAGEALPTLARDLRYPDVSALYAAVGEGHLSAQTVVQRLVQALGGPEGAAEDLAETAVPTKASRARPPGDPGVVVKGASDVWVKLARCCTPVPGDTIIGFVTRGRGVSVHRTDCVNVAGLGDEPERFVEVRWAPSERSVFLVAIQIEALDRTRLLSDVTSVLSDHHVNILSASVTTNRDRVAVSRFTFEMADPAHLGHLLQSVRTVEGVYDAYRVVSPNAS